jgi:hypothetical protein
MPRIQQYVAQDMTGGAVRGGGVAQPVDLSGLARGVDSFARASEDLRIHQERMSERMADDEAKVAVTNTLSQAGADWTEKLQNAQTGAAAGAPGFTAGMLKEFDGWAKDAGAQVPERGRQHLEQQLGRFRQGLHADAFRFEVKARGEKLTTDFVAGLENDRKAVFAQPGQFTETLARRLATAETLDLPAATKAKLAETARESLAIEAASAQVERDPEGLLARLGIRGAKVGKDGKMMPTDEAKAAEAVRNDPVFASLSPQALRQVVDRATMISETRKAQAAAEADRQARLAEIAANRRAREADQAWNILSTWTAAGKVADESNPNTKALIGRLAGTPYASAFTEMQKTAAAGATVASMPLPQQQAQLDGLIARRNASGTSPELETEIKRREGMLTEARSDYAKEPMRAALDRRVFGPEGMAPVDTSSIDGVARTIGARVQQAQTVAGRAGRSVSPLLSEEAETIGRVLSQVPPEQFGAAVAKLSGQIPGDQLQALARQIDSKDRGLALALAAGDARTTQGRTVAELIRRGQQVVKDKGIKEETAAEFGLKAQIAKEVRDVVPGRWGDDVIDAARLIYLGKQAGGDSTDAANAVRLALGGSIIEHNGRRVPVQPGITEDVMRQRLSTITPASLADQLPDGVVYLPGGRPMGLPEFLARLPDAQLEPLPGGEYAVRVGASGVAMRADRRPLTIKVR